MHAHKMTMWHAWRDGIRRVNRAPAVLGAVWLIVALLAWPIAMSSRIDGAPGLRVAGRPLDFAARWLDELRDHTVERSVEFGSGVAQSVEDFTAFVDYESRWMVSLAASYPFLALLMLVSGGIIDRYARDRPTGVHGVSAVSGVFFFRFLRLGVLIAATYAVAFRLLGQWPGVLAAALGACNLVVEYTQVRAVVEDRRSMLAALRAAISFIRRNWLSAVALYAIDYAMRIAWVGLYVFAGPGGSFRFGPDRSIVWTIGLWIVINQLYVVGALWIRLVFWASETALFQSRLAHAGYVARPLPVWPDSASVEAIKRM
jgi:hypothetical protein